MADFHETLGLQKRTNPHYFAGLASLHAVLSQPRSPCCCDLVGRVLWSFGCGGISFLFLVFRTHAVYILHVRDTLTALTTLPKIAQRGPVPQRDAAIHLIKLLRNLNVTCRRQSVSSSRRTKRTPGGMRSTPEVETLSFEIEPGGGRRQAKRGPERKSRAWRGGDTWVIVRTSTARAKGHHVTAELRTQPFLGLQRVVFLVRQTRPPPLLTASSRRERLQQTRPTLVLAAHSPPTQ